MAFGIGRAVAVARVAMVVDDPSRDLAQAERAVQGSTQRMGSSVTNLGTTATAVGKGLVAGLGAATVIQTLRVVTDASIEAELAQARLVTQLRASGISYGAFKDRIDEVITSQSRLSALDDEDLYDSFTTILRVTGDVNEALRLNALAADIARARQIDLATAGLLVSKVAGGNIGILSRYGIVVEKGATATEALATLQQKFAGQAAAYGESTAGSLGRANVAIEEIQESIGALAAPGLAELADAITLVTEGIFLITGALGEMQEAVDDVSGGLVSLKEHALFIASGPFGALISGGRAIKEIFDDDAEAAGGLGRALNSISDAMERLSGQALILQNALDPNTLFGGTAALFSTPESSSLTGSLGPNAPGAAGTQPITRAQRAAEAGIVATARSYGPGSGIVYNWGGTTPQQGFDCSGYLVYIYAQHGITIPRDTRSQWADPAAMPINDPSQLRPGDGVYFAGSLTGKNAGPPPGHVGIYIGNGQYIEYFSQGKPAKVSSLGSRRDFMGGRRWLKFSNAYEAAAPVAPYSPPAAAAAAEPSAQTQFPGISGISGTLQNAISNVLGGASPGSYDYDPASGKLVGPPVIRFDPKRKRYIITRLSPDIAALVKLRNHYKNKVLPGIDARIRATQASISALNKRKKTAGSAEKASLQNKLAALRAERREVMGIINDLNLIIRNLRAAIKVGEEEKAEAAAEAAADAAEAQAQAEGSLVNLPADVRLAIAEAGGTAGVGDDLSALQRAAGYYQGALGRGTFEFQGQQVPFGIETRIALTEALNGVRSQIDRIVESQKESTKATKEAASAVVSNTKTFEEYLQMVRDLRGFRGNLYGAAPELAGRQILLQAYFPSAPKEPHAWAKALELELKALV